MKGRCLWRGRENGGGPCPGQLHAKDGYGVCTAIVSGCVLKPVNIIFLYLRTADW